MTDAHAITIERLGPDSWAEAVPLVQQLRPHIDGAAFAERMTAQVPLGYEMYAARDGAVIVGLAGFRPVVTFSRGPYLHLDDLIVDAARRRSGVGERLLAHVEAEARRRGCVAVFLDARPTAIPFYEACGYGLHPSPSMWKGLG